MTPEPPKPPSMTSRREDTTSTPPLGQRAFRLHNIALSLLPLVVLWHVPLLAQLRARVGSPSGVCPTQPLAGNKDRSIHSLASHGNYYYRLARTRTVETTR